MSKFIIDFEDDFDNMKVGTLEYKTFNWGCNEPYINNPGKLNIEFIFESGEDNSQEVIDMEILKEALNENDIPFNIIDVNEDGELIYIQVLKEDIIS